jgi:phage baseplate assembly protein W
MLCSRRWKARHLAVAAEVVDAIWRYESRISEVTRDGT